MIYAYSVAFGHTALSLATTESGNTKSPRIVPIGIESYAVTSAVGTIGQGVNVQFVSPIVVNPGEYFAITARNVGTVTTAGAITHSIGVDHYFE